ncbi:MAG: hypothetical protein COA70_06595 [Planctomycetota bacterium]|nr:MAG: hypothetical protein COA70_06595 [Planctomycetota bacterium]
MIIMTLAGSFGLACSDNQSAEAVEISAPTWKTVVENQLQAYAGEGLPDISLEDQEDILDLIDLSLTHDKGYRQAHQVFDNSKQDWLTSVMLALVEGRDADAEIKAEAYRWLSVQGVEAMLPRLTLRLKYEKDWAANVDIALGLLRFGCGAGLEPLVIILRTEEGITDLDRARWAAIEALKALPPKTGWIPGENFDDDWKRLLEIETAWRLTHMIPDQVHPAEPSRGYRAEVWKTLAQFRSQRLRPVDDARYLLMRQPSWAFTAIVHTTYDEVWYVREHALQTLAWIGAPIGVWAKRTELSLESQLAPLLGDLRLRGRVLEAMGATGLAEMQAAILPWLREGNLEESTAAADALLRCANRDIVRPIEALLASTPYLSPEGNYALECLLHAFDAEYIMQIPDGIDPSEITRRDRWAAQRPLF